MNKISKATEGVFRLLVPTMNSSSSEDTFVELGGKQWVLREFARISDAPPYTCISYSWGKGRTENMFEDGELMSDRTIPAIETTIKASLSPKHWINALMCVSRDEQKREEALTTAIKASQAIWIDALCVPSRDPARAACLRNMGAIYSSAEQVFVVLPAICSEILHKIYKAEQIGLNELRILDNDDWMTRAWTYQESANSQMTLFIAQGDGSVLIHEHDFLNAILTDTTDYADAQGLARSELAIQFPKLDSLQEMIAEHKMVEYTGRSAYQVMAAMHPRYAEREEDRIYAMIGVVTNFPSDSQEIHPAEYFMRACEEKSDYSFIFCTAPRSDLPGRGWRPVADTISPVLSGLLVSGNGLSGHLEKTHLQLDRMCRMRPSTVNPDALTAIGKFLQSDSVTSPPADIVTAVLERLKNKGFSGSGDYLELENGYFFPQSTYSYSDEVFVIASEDVQWLNGGPGLLVRSNGTDIHQFCDVGVFVGKFPKACESINVG